MLEKTNKILVLFIFVGSFVGCSDDNATPGCFQELGLEIIETIKSEPGTIRAPGNIFCSEEYVIEPDERVESRPLGALIPCNLTMEFRVDGARVVFSGYVYERINDGDQCADFFEITEIDIVDETP